METLESLLDDLRARGVFESSDSFGIDVARGEVKAAQFQLADPGHYVLKVLQAAATSEATAVYVWLRSNEVEVFAPGPVSREEIERLANGRPQNEHLMMGLRAGSVLKTRELYWELWEGNDGVKLSFKKDGSLALSRERTNRKDSGSSFHLRKPQGWFDPPPSMAAEHHAVSTRARHFPVPLKLDGRVLTGPLTHGQTATVAGQSVHADALLARRLLVARGPGLLTPLKGSWLYEVEGRAQENPGSAHDALFFQRPNTFLTQLVRIDHEQPWFTPETTRLKPDLPDSLTCHAELSLPLHGQGRGEVTFVKHGVSLTPLKAELGWPGARAVVSLAVTTDLSQFTVVQSVGLENMVLYLEAHVRSLKNDLRYHLDRLRLEQPELYRHFQERLSISKLR